MLWRRMSLVMLTLATGPARHRRRGWQQRTDQWLALPRAALQHVDRRPWTVGPDVLTSLLAAAAERVPQS